VLAGQVGGKNPKISNDEGVWVAVERLGEQALPSLMRKVAAHALRHLAG